MNKKNAIIYLVGLFLTINLFGQEVQVNKNIIGIINKIFFIYVYLQAHPRQDLT